MSNKGELVGYAPLGGDVIMPENYSKNLPVTPEFDLMQLNLLSLANQLKSTLNSGRWVIFKGWGNRRMELDLERQHLIIRQIDALGLAAEILARVQAKVFLSQRMFEANLAAFDAEIEAGVKRVRNELARLDDEYETIRLQAEEREENLRRKKLENDMFELRERAEINLINAREEKEKAFAEFIRDALRSINISEFPPTLQTYIVSSVFNPSGSQFTDFDMQEQIKKFVIQQEEAKANKMSGEAEKERVNAEDLRFNFEQKKKDEEIIRNKNK